MLRILFFLTLWFVPSIFYAQDIAGLVSGGQKAEVAMDDGTAILRYKEALKLESANIYLLCKCSELCRRIAGRLSDNTSRQEEYYKAAETYARTAVRINPLSSDANFVMSLVMGRNVQHSGGSEKIDAVKKLKMYADLAIKYDPLNYKSWYVLGKWYYEISGLNYFERVAVKLFFEALPTATTNDTNYCFEKVKAIDRSFILNYMSLAEAYKRKEEEALAKQSLSVMLSLPDQLEDDEQIKHEGRGLLKKWQ